MRNLATVLFLMAVALVLGGCSGEPAAPPQETPPTSSTADKTYSEAFLQQLRDAQQLVEWEATTLVVDRAGCSVARAPRGWPSNLKFSVEIAPNDTWDDGSPRFVTVTFRVPTEATAAFIPYRCTLVQWENLPTGDIQMRLGMSYPYWISPGDSQMKFSVFDLPAYGFDVEEVGLFQVQFPPVQEGPYLVQGVAVDERAPAGAKVRVIDPYKPD